MPYIAELYRFLEGERRSLGSTEIDAPDDGEAGRLEADWAIPELGEMLGFVAYLEVVRDGKCVFSKTYGEL